MFKRILSYFLILFSLTILFTANATGETKKHSALLATATQQLSVEQTHNLLLNHKLATLQAKNKQPLATQTVDANTLQRANIALKLAAADLQGIQLSLTATTQTVAITNNNIESLHNQLENNSTLGLTSNAISLQQKTIQTQLAEQQDLLNLQQSRVQVLQQSLALAKQTLAAIQDWKNQLQATYLLQQQSAHQKELDALALSLQKEQEGWLNRLAQLNQQLQSGNKTNVTTPNYTRLESEIFEAEERSTLIQIQLDLARFNNHLQELTTISTQPLSLTTSNNAQHQADTLVSQLKDLKKNLEDKNSLINQRIILIKQSVQNGLMNPDDAENTFASFYGLLDNYQKQLSTTNTLLTKANAIDQLLTQRFNDQLSNRQGFPGFDKQAWLSLGEKLAQLPFVTIETWHEGILTLSTAFHGISYWSKIGGFLLLGLWGLFWYFTKHSLSLATRALNLQTEGLLSQQALLLFSKLLNKHLNSVMTLFGFLGILFFLNIPFSTFGTLIGVAIVWIIFSLILGMIQSVLLDSTDKQQSRNIKLYHRLRSILLFGGFLTAATVFVHQMPVAYDVQDFFGRLFMLFLLIVALVLLRVWFSLPSLLTGSLEKSRPYVKTAVRWLSLLIPLTILSNALIGLIGYVELAFNIAAYQGLFLIALTIYLLANGLLGELMRLTSERLIRRLKNGWLWSEALLKPCHLLLKILLAIAIIALLFYLFGWGKHSWALMFLTGWLDFRLFSFAGSIITPRSLIELAILIAVIIWATKWTREFAYRWVFARTKDAGLRNSLAIFSQYTMVAVGVLIILRVMGINLTALTFIASAFAVGIGFGLRDLANNFVSGIFLLIERPVRVGDYVSVGTFEGEVVHIGMRSITVTTDDHQELLVPNANIFSQSFINWTHRDSVVRSVIKFNISRVDDPHQITKIILSVLKQVPEALTHPEPVVYFRNMDEMLLAFQLEYFTDMRRTSRDATRSKVLFALWDSFEKEGIHAPEAPHEIKLINENPH